MPIPRSLNTDFFKRWSADMAYVLGYFAADGNMIRNRRGAHFVAFYSNDRGILEVIRRSFGSNHKIGVRMYKHFKPNYQLQLGSRVLFSDLNALGMRSAKSRTLTLPDVPVRFHSDFVRGYFDGDGCVYFGRSRCADRIAPRSIFMVKFTCGSRGFLDALHILLKRHGVVGGSVRAKWGGSGFDLTLSHREET